MWRPSSSSSTRCTTSAGTERSAGVGVPRAVRSRAGRALFRMHGPLTALLLVLAGLAPAASMATGVAGAKPAPVSQACRFALRDVAYYCRSSLVIKNPESRYDCLAARLRVNRFCYPTRPSR